MQMWKCSVLKGWHWEEYIRDTWELKCRLRPDDPEDSVLAMLDICKERTVSSRLTCVWGIMNFEHDLLDPCIWEPYDDADGRGGFETLDDAKKFVEEAVVARLVDLQHQVELLRTIFEA